MKIGILWDLDGTLLDTLEDLTAAVNYALQQNGYHTRKQEEIRSFVGNGVRQLIRLCVPEGEDMQPVLEAFREYYAVHCQDQTCPYPGIPEVLEQLGKKYTMAIVSNKPDPLVKSLCNRYFKGIYARGEVADCPRKPAPDMLLRTMETLGVDGCIYVGDSDVDVLTAQNAAVPCLSVLWGFRDRESITAAGGTHFCQTPGQLPEMLDAIASKME